ncbi:MAG: DUF3052 domain-containing protein [Sphingobacteriales bacterium]
MDKQQLPANLVNYKSINLPMATAGYSGAPLLKKLGIKPIMKVILMDVPDNYFDLLETDITRQLCKKNDVPDLIHLFAFNNKAFEAGMKKILSYVKKNKQLIIWVSWYKKSSGLATDITEDFIRNYALRNGLVDIKVCSVSDIWSGLKLVVPVSKR